jgi:hypothetical protein
MSDLSKQSELNPIQKSNFSEIFSQRSYDVNIECQILFCKTLEPMARLLYGAIKNLTKQEGYCWANNHYFAESFDVDERTIRRWLKSLIDHEIIEIEFENEEYKSNRKIYLKHRIKIKNTPDKNVLPPGQKCPTPRTKMSAISQYPNSLEEQESVAAAPPQKIKILSAPGKEEAIEISQLYQRALIEKKPWRMDEMKQAWEALSQCKNIVYDWWRFIEGTIKNIRLKQTSENFAKGKYKCKNTTKKNNIYEEESEKHSEQIKKTPVLAKLSVLDYINLSKNGLPIPEGSL